MLYHYARGATKALRITTKHNINDMRKTIFTLAALALGSFVSQGAMTWVGGDTITQALWQTESSWDTTDSTWTGTGSGPQTPNSNMWDQINVSNASGSIGTLEGWKIKLSLENANLTVGSLKKFQSEDNSCRLTIDSASSLTINKFGDGDGYDGNIVYLTNYGTFNMAYNKEQGGSGFNVNLGETGIMNLTVVSGTHTAKITDLVAILGEGGTITGVTADGNLILTRTLVTLGEGMSFDGSTTCEFTDKAGATMTAVDDLTTAAVGSYKVTSDVNGLSVSYVVVPEPATASLSLLGLAALMMRRRRA